MAKKILVHGSGHKAASWKETVSCMDGKEELLCPDLCALLAGKTASYPSLYGAFAEYCDHVGRAVHLCGLSLGGILALHYALIFRFLPRSVFDTMAFDKESTFVLGNSMKKLDFSGRVRGMRCPVLIICGEKDRSNIRSAQYLSQNIPGAELQLIEHTGHVVNEENPKALAERLNKFYSLHP